MIFKVTVIIVKPFSGLAIVEYILGIEDETLNSAQQLTLARNRAARAVESRGFRWQSVTVEACCDWGV